METCETCLFAGTPKATPKGRQQANPGTRTYPAGHPLPKQCAAQRGIVRCARITAISSVRCVSIDFCFFPSSSSAKYRQPIMARRAAPPQAHSRGDNAGAGQNSMQAVLSAARSTGTIDLSDRGLTDLPREVFYLDELPQPAPKVRVRAE